MDWSQWPVEVLVGLGFALCWFCAIWGWLVAAMYRLLSGEIPDNMP